MYIYMYIYMQWRSQRDNLLPQCKIPSDYHYSFLYKLIVFTVSEL